MNILALICTLAFGFLCLLADTCVEGVVITPFLGLCWVLLAAFRLNWKTVLLLALVLWGFVILSLANQNLATILVRSSSFLIGCGLAVAFSHARNRNKKTLEFIETILHKIPTPVVVCDVTGQIVLCNCEATKLVEPTLRPLNGYSFADIFMGNLPPGRAMKVFLDWVNREGEHSEVLFLRDNLDKPMEALLCSIMHDSERLLLVSLEQRSTP